MLLCPINEVNTGMTVAAVVLHPHKPEIELLYPGAELTGTIIHRLKAMGVAELWVNHDALADLDAVLAPQLTQVRRSIYQQIKQDFQDLSARTICTAQLLNYKQMLMRLVFELIGNLRTAGLTEQLFSSEDQLFSHGSNVAYLATLAGLELEPYVVSQRKTLALEHARDMSTLGLGAMLHDIGKSTLPSSSRHIHEIHLANDADTPEGYERHTRQGYEMLRDSRAPASATQVVLNHHQRYNGNGWPDMIHTTGQRRRGPQQGRGIHVFSRIVSAANVLDNLLRSGEGRRRPPVAALNDLAGPRFDGWFDPVVRQVMLRRMPPFQIGSQVTLNDGSSAAVLAPNPRQPCRPVLRILNHPAGLPEGRYPTVRLEERPDLWIAVSGGVNVERWLFELPEPARLRTEA